MLGKSIYVIGQLLIIFGSFAVVGAFLNSAGVIALIFSGAGGIVLGLALMGLGSLIESTTRIERHLKWISDNTRSAAAATEASA